MHGEKERGLARQEFDGNTPVVSLKGKLVMKAQEDIQTEEIKLNEQSLEDLSVVDEQADEAKAGGSPTLFLHCSSGKHLKE